MSEKNPIHWFEIPVSDIKRATTFYEQVVGVSLQPLEQDGVKMAWFPRHQGVEGSTGGLIEAEGRTPSKSGTMIYLTVPDVDAALARVGAAGGKTVLPRAKGDYGSVAHFEDSEGNLVGLFSET